MTIIKEVKYEVGQPVWVYAGLERNKGFVVSYIAHKEKGDMYRIRFEGEDIKDEIFPVIVNDCTLRPRPTLYWTLREKAVSVRQWFKSFKK